MNLLGVFPLAAKLDFLEPAGDWESAGCARGVEGASVSGGVEVSESVSTGSRLSKTSRKASWMIP